MSPREQIIAVAAGVIVLFYVVYNWMGLGETLASLRRERASLTELRSQHESHRSSLRFRPMVIREYDRYRSHSIARDPTKDPADEFSEYINDTIREIGPRLRPALHPTEIEEIEGVESYQQILLPVDITMDLDPLIEFLTTLDQERLMIRRLEIRSRETQHPNMTVKAVISRLVSTDDLQGDAGGSERERSQ